MKLLNCFIVLILMYMRIVKTFVYSNKVGIFQHFKTRLFHNNNGNNSLDKLKYFIKQQINSLLLRHITANDIHYNSYIHKSNIMSNDILEYLISQVNKNQSNEQLNDNLPKNSSHYNKELSDRYIIFSDSLFYYLKYNYKINLTYNKNNIFELLSTLLSNYSSIDNIISTYQNKVIDNKNIFNNITNHHTKLLSNQLQINQLNDTVLSNYAFSAKQMGEKNWVIESHKWLLDFTLQYFRYGISKTFYLKLIDDIKNRNILKNILLDDLFYLNNKIKVLDIGSCYNPLNSHINSKYFDITAIDLYPMDDSVYQCNFFDLLIGESDSKPVIQINQANKKKLIQLPRNSFDCITISLVLSYLPTPELRQQMIEKAYELLIKPNELDSTKPHHNGLLLIIEKLSIFPNNNDNDLLYQWKQSIQQCGFHLLKYRTLIPTDEKVKRSHMFAFSTLPHRQFESKIDRKLDQKVDINTSFNKFKMHIRQDFMVNNDISNTISSTDSTSINLSSDTVDEVPIAIIGGGLGGTALGLSLQQRRIPFMIYEQDESFGSRKQGYALTMQQAAITLRSLELSDDLFNSGVTSYAHESYDSKGRLIGAYGPFVRNGKLLCDNLVGNIDGNIDNFVQDIINKSKGRHNIHIPRQKLREIIVNKINNQSIQWNKKLITYNYTTVNNQKKIKLEFSDNSTVISSLVVAADGIHSAIRKLDSQSDCQNQTLNYLGLIVILGISSSTKQSCFLLNNQLFRKQIQWLDGNTRVFAMPFNHNQTMWQMSYPIDESAAINIMKSYNYKSELKNIALDRCKGWDSNLIDLIESSDPLEISGYPIYDRDPMVSNDQSNRLITYIGDAAHPMSPFKGQGANQALLDVLKLSKYITLTNISNDYNISRYIKIYENEMIERSKIKQIKSRDAAYYLHNPIALTQGNITRAMAAELTFTNNQNNQNTNI